MTKESTPDIYKNTTFEHTLYRDEYASLSNESKEEIQKELADFFKKGLQAHNGYKEKFIKSRVDYWASVENVSRKIYFDVTNHQNGILTSNAKLSLLSGIPQDHPEFAKIITDATSRVLRHQRPHTPAKLKNTITKQKEPQKNHIKKRIYNKLGKNMHLVYFGASAIISAIGVKELFYRHSDIIKPFLQSSTEQALNICGQVKSDEAIIILASGASILGGSYIAKHILKSRKNRTFNILKSKFFNRTR